MEKLIIGAIAPDFECKDQNGNIIKLSSFKSRKVILYFYPKDNTTGCTAEACSLRDGYSELKKMGFEIIGVSPDSEKSHINFIAKHTLPYTLLADTNKEIATLYGVWGEKKLYGKTYFGILRTTFLIDENGLIMRIFNKVDTKNHFIQIADSLK